MRVRIIIDVQYDESSVPAEETMIKELEQNIYTQISDGLLLDSWSEAIVDDYKVKIEKK